MLIEEIRNIKSNRKDLRNFGLLMGSILVLIGSWFMWRQRPYYPYFMGVGAFLAVAGVVFAPLLKPLHRAWMALAACMGWVMTRLILAILFYAIITPLSLLSRIVGKRFLDTGWDEPRKSYWNYRPKEGATSKSCEKQY
jgi:hypothetical protein